MFRLLLERGEWVWFGAVDPEKVRFVEGDGEGLWWGGLKSVEWWSGLIRGGPCGCGGGVGEGEGE